MTDVNYVEYGANAVRLTNTGSEFTHFLAENGYAIGVVLGLIVVIFFVLLILVFGASIVKKMIP